MSLVRKSLVTLIGVLAAASIQAAPVTVNFTLTADQLGDNLPIFGISSLPTGPFSGSFRFDDTALNGTNFSLVTLSAFTATVGDFSWGLEDVTGAQLRADAQGALDRVTVYAHDGDWGLSLVFGAFTNTSWFASDASPATGFGGCGWQGVGAQDMYGACVGGSANAYSFTQVSGEPSHVPLPSSLLLAGLALGGAGLLRRRNR